MKLWVTGSQDWDNDMILARAITLAIQEMSEDDNQIHFLHLDREGAEQMAGSYVAKTKSFLSGKVCFYGRKNSKGFRPVPRLYAFV
jgi:hypothetical protein